MRSLATVDAEAVHEAPLAVPPEPQPLAEVAVAAAETRGNGQRRWAIGIAAAASFLWLAVSAASIYLVVRYLPLAQVTLTALAGIAAGVTAPLTAIWVIALVFARTAPGEAQLALRRIEAAEARFADVTARTRRELDAIDGVLGAVAERVDGLRGAIGGQAAALMETAGQMEWRAAAVSSALGRDREAIELLLDRLTAGSSAARAELGAVIEGLPAAERQAAAIHTALAGSADASRAQIEYIDLMLKAVKTEQAKAEERTADAASRLRDALAAASAAGGEAAERIDSHTQALAGSIDAAMSRAADALEAARTGVEAQVEAVVTATAQARRILVDLGGDAAKAAGERLGELASEAERLTAALARQEADSHKLVEAVERGFGVLDAKLANAAQSGHATLERLDARLAGVRGQIHDLTTPLADAGDQTRTIEAAVTALRLTTRASLDQLATALPDSVAITGAAVDDLRAAVTALSADVQRAGAQAEAVVAPVAAGSDAIADAADALAAHRRALDETMTGIAGRLAEAKAMVAELETGADATAMTATTKLLEALGRVHEVAAQAEGAVRQALDRAVADARTSLAIAGDEALQTAFATPVAAKLAEVHAASEASAEAARAATGRLSAQLFGVLEAAESVESRIAATDARLESVSRDDLARRSGLLIDALNSASIDIAKALATDVTDTAWAAYLRGDKSVFTRRAVRLLGGGAARAVARQFETDGEFRDSVRRYVHDFEALMQRVGGERDAGSLQIAMLSSDVGKLYVALAQALERIRS